MGKRREEAGKKPSTAPSGQYNNCEKTNWLEPKEHQSTAGLPHIWLSTANPSTGLPHNYNIAPGKGRSEHIQSADQQSGRKPERTRGGAKAKGGTRGSWTDPAPNRRLEKKGIVVSRPCVHTWTIPGLLDGLPACSSLLAKS